MQRNMKISWNDFFFFSSVWCNCWCEQGKWETRLETTKHMRYMELATVYTGKYTDRLYCRRTGIYGKVSFKMALAILSSCLEQNSAKEIIAIVQIKRSHEVHCRHTGRKWHRSLVSFSLLKNHIPFTYLPITSWKADISSRSKMTTKWREWKRIDCSSIVTL